MGLRCTLFRIRFIGIRTNILRRTFEEDSSKVYKIWYILNFISIWYTIKCIFKIQPYYYIFFIYINIIIIQTIKLFFSNAKWCAWNSVDIGYSGMVGCINDSILLSSGYVHHIWLFQLETCIFYKPNLYLFNKSFQRRFSIFHIYVNDTSITTLFFVSISI